MRISFPSKLTDYAATGLPLLIQGPEYCSAVRWAKSYEGVAEVLTSQSDDELARGLERLEQQEHRIRLGRTAARVGAQLFSHDVAVETFYNALVPRPLTWVLNEQSLV